MGLDREWGTTVLVEKDRWNEERNITLPSGHAGRRRLIIALTVLAFIAIGSVALYAISLIVGAVLLLIFSALLAYLIYPLVQFLQRRLPHPLAIAVAYLLVASFLAVGIFIVVSALIRQLSALAQSIQFLLSPAGEHRIQSAIDYLSDRLTQSVEAQPRCRSE